MIEVCLHCRTRKVSRPRGLCWNCFYTPGLREQYQTQRSSDGKRTGRRGIANGYINPPAPVRPTEARPGSREKIQAMIERTQAGEGLWHPQDGRV